MKNLDVTKKICVIKQPGGLGDIFYLQKLASHFQKQNYQIYWYVISKYLWIKNYIPEIYFKDKKSNDLFSPLNYDQPFFSLYNSNEPLTSGEIIYLPTLFADKILDYYYPNKMNKIMKSKYELFNMTDDNWQDYFLFNRNSEKENKLFSEIFNLNEDDEYCLISENITPYDNEKKIIPYDGKLKKINLDFIDGYTLFDWCKIIENAKEIHIMDSSVSLLLDKLKIKSENTIIYSRRGNDFSEIDYLYSGNYKFKPL